MDHAHEELDHFSVVLLVVNVAIDFLNSLALLNDEVLARAHFALNSVEEHVSTPIELLLNDADVLSEFLLISRLVDFDKVLVASVEEENDAALRLITSLNSVLVEKIRHLLVSVHVEELAEVLITNLLYHLPGVVLGSCQLEQLHLLWSNHSQSPQVISYIWTTYLQTMSVVCLSQRKVSDDFYFYNNSSR